MKESKFVDAAEAAVMLGCSVRHARRLLRDMKPFVIRGQSEWGVRGGRTVVRYPRAEVEKLKGVTK